MKKSLIIVILILIIWNFLTFGFTAIAEQKIQKLTPSEIYAQYVDCVVSVLDEDRIIGTGFFISETGMVLTNYHVIKGEKTLSVRIKSGNVFKVNEIIAEDARSDLALLSLDITNKNIPHFKISEIAPIVGSKIAIIGSPLGFEYFAPPGTLVRTKLVQPLAVNWYTVTQ